MVYPERCSIISFSPESVIKVSELQDEIEELEEDLLEFQRDYTLQMEEIAATQRLLSMSSQPYQMLHEQSKMVNTGKNYEDVGSKQKRRKLSIPAGS